MSLSELTCSIFTGTVSHVRLSPTKNSFEFKFGCYFLPLAGSEKKINNILRVNKLKGAFKRANYFGDVQKCLSETVLIEASRIAKREISGSVYLLGQIKQFGAYFSPVNFYFIMSENSQEFKYMLAEVTNTPWSEKYCYLVDVEKCEDQNKEFHVSPFNPMNMKYKWRVEAHSESIFIRLGCYRESKEFEAVLRVNKDSEKKRNFLFMNFKIILGIYYQALVLYLKRTPIYDHPKQEELNGYFGEKT